MSHAACCKRLFNSCRHSWWALAGRAPSKHQTEAHLKAREQLRECLHLFCSAAPATHPQQGPAGSRKHRLHYCSCQGLPLLRLLLHPAEAGPVQHQQHDTLVSCDHADRALLTGVDQSSLTKAVAPDEPPKLC